MPLLPGISNKASNTEKLATIPLWLFGHLKALLWQIKNLLILSNNTNVKNMTIR